jgi:hypothetical protein
MQPGELRRALKKDLHHDSPVFVDMIVNRRALSILLSISTEQPLGFSRDMDKAVPSGRGDAVTDLVKKNHFRSMQ